MLHIILKQIEVLLFAQKITIYLGEYAHIF